MLIILHRNDYLSLYDGDNVFASEIGRFSGNFTPTDITISGSSVSMLFTSDEYSRNHTGFQVKINAGM